jgi:hypothetical protein
MFTFGFLTFIYLIISSFYMVSNIFSLMLFIRLGVPHLTICGMGRCIYGWFIDSMKIHFFMVLQGRMHCNPQHHSGFFASITKYVGFHVLHEQTHVFPLFSFYSLKQQVDIMFTTNGVHTLTNIIIINPTQANLISRVIFFCGVATMIVT